MVKISIFKQLLLKDIEFIIKVMNIFQINYEAFIN